jgi:hypothetical protein
MDIKILNRMLMDAGQLPACLVRTTSTMPSRYFATRIGNIPGGIRVTLACTINIHINNRQENIPGGSGVASAAAALDRAHTR